MSMDPMVIRIAILAAVLLVLGALVILIVLVIARGGKTHNAKKPRGDNSACHDIDPWEEAGKRLNEQPDELD